MRFLILGLILLSAWAVSAHSDSLDGASVPPDSHASALSLQRADSADSLHHSASVVQNWIFPLALAVAVGTSFVLLFVVRSR